MQVRKSIGPFAAPKAVYVVDDLPKTRSGKIMRRILRKILSDEEDQLGDISTLSDPSVVEAIIRDVHTMQAPPAPMSSHLKANRILSLQSRIEAQRKPYSVMASTGVSIIFFLFFCLD